MEVYKVKRHRQGKLNLVLRVEMSKTGGHYFQVRGAMFKDVRGCLVPAAKDGSGSAGTIVAF